MDVIEKIKRKLNHIERIIGKRNIDTISNIESLIFNLQKYLENINIFLNNLEKELENLGLENIKHQKIKVHVSVIFVVK